MFYKSCLNTDVFFIIETACKLLEKMKNSIFIESSDILLDTDCEPLKKRKTERVSAMLI